MSTTTTIFIPTILAICTSSFLTTFAAPIDFENALSSKKECQFIGLGNGYNAKVESELVSVTNEGLLGSQRKFYLSLEISNHKYLQINKVYQFGLGFAHSNYKFNFKDNIYTGSELFGQVEFGNLEYEFKKQISDLKSSITRILSSWRAPTNLQDKNLQYNMAVCAQHLLNSVLPPVNEKD